MYVLPGLHRHARPLRREEQGTTASTSSSSGWRTASPPFASRAAATASTGAPRARPQREERDRRAAHLPVRLHDEGRGTAAPIDSPEQARKFVQLVAQEGRRRHQDPRRRRPDLRPRDPGRAARRGAASRPRLDHASVADGRGAHEHRSTPRASGCAAWSIGTDCPSRCSPTGRFRTIPTGYNYNDEQDRFGDAGRLWNQAAPPGIGEVERRIDELVKHFTFDPTLTSTRRSRDLMRAMRAEWHDRTRCRRSGTSTSRSRDRARLVLVRLDHRGRGRVEELLPASGCGSSTTTRTAAAASPPAPTPASSSRLYGFDYIRELELLREAGFHPLEVIRSATMWGAEALDDRRERRRSASCAPGNAGRPGDRRPRIRCAT